MRILLTDPGAWFSCGRVYLGSRHAAAWNTSPGSDARKPMKLLVWPHWWQSERKEEQWKLMSDTYNDTMSQGAFVGSHIWWVWGTRGCLGDVIRKFPKRGFGVLVNVLLSVCPFFWTGADCSCCDLFTLHVHACSPHHTDSNDKTWPECQVTQDLNPQQLSLDWLFQLLYFSWVLVEHKLRTLALGASGLDGSQQAAAVGFGGLTLCLKFVEILVADKMKRLQRRIQWPVFESIPNLSLPHFRDVPFTSIHIDLQHVSKGRRDENFSTPGLWALWKAYSARGQVLRRLLSRCHTGGAGQDGISLA